MKSKLDLAEFLGIPELPQYLLAVNKQLLESVKTNNQQIFEPISRLIKVGGKRLRPALVIACASINGQPIDSDVIKLAASVELLHLGSLVHDDIIDEADTRWNVDTINKIEGSNQAIVIGDYLLATACSLAASVSQEASKLIADTIMNLCDGQNRELNDVYNLSRPQESMMMSITGKTAALICASCVLGGINANLSKEELKSLEQFGHNFGVSFQLIDDLMDLVSTEKLYGKSIGTDIVEGVYTLPILLTLKSPQSGKLKKILHSRQYNPTATDLAFMSGAIAKTIVEINYHNDQASKAIQSLSNQHLINLPANYFDWVINNLVAKEYKNKILKMQKV